MKKITRNTLRIALALSFGLVTACGGGGSSAPKKDPKVTTVKPQCTESSIINANNQWQISQSDTRLCTPVKTTTKTCGPNEYAVRVPICQSGSYDNANCQYATTTTQTNGGINYSYHRTSGQYQVVCKSYNSSEFNYGYIYQVNGYLYLNLYAVMQYQTQYQYQYHKQVELSPKQVFMGVLGLAVLSALLN